MLIAQPCWKRFHRGLAVARYRQWTSDLLALRWRRLVLRLKAQKDRIVVLDDQCPRSAPWQGARPLMEWTCQRRMAAQAQIHSCAYQAGLYSLRWATKQWWSALRRVRALAFRAAQIAFELLPDTSANHDSTDAQQ